MKKTRSKRYTLYKPGHVPGNEIGSARKTPQARADISARFRIACAEAGMSVDQVAQALHVTPRTVRYWFSGQTVVPYAAYRLIRITNTFELPGQAWAGWHMHSGKLWTPEGFAFEPGDASWWALIVRQARSFRTVYAELSRLQRERHGVSPSGPPMVITGITHGVSSPEKEVPSA